MSYNKKFTECISNIIKNINYNTTAPSFYKIIFKKDDSYSQNFLYLILIDVFKKDHREISDYFKTLDKTGKLALGPYTKDVAETKISSTKECAFANGKQVNISLQEGEHNVIKKP